MSHQVPWKGMLFEDGGYSIIVPPLSLRMIKEYAEIIDKCADPLLSVKERRELMAQIVFFALKRNYPDITQELVLEFCSIDNTTDMYSAAVGLWDPKLKVNSATGEPWPGSEAAQKNLPISTGTGLPGESPLLVAGP